MKSRTLLVVDADPKVRALVKARMEAEGWRVRQAATGLQALAICACRSFDAVLTDLNLPGIGADELAHAILERFPAVTIIGMSAEPPDSPPATISGWLRKPLEAETLAGRLLEVLQATPKKQAAGAAAALYRLRKPG